ncbi:hypothetical protein ACJ3XI_04805 [Litorimonas sp. RW-G-Af-16]|uniref:hypothetical protein n=1 Tax=Litorimonas sp. RW-G-Af-16 TaxID=3241168 RepID=UPI00390CC880
MRIVQGKAAKTAHPTGEWELIMGWNTPARDRARLSEDERNYLRAGLSQSGAKLPLFDLSGQRIDPKVQRACIQKGLCEPWFANPMKPDWLVCRLTEAGREALRR